MHTTCLKIEMQLTLITMKKIIKNKDSVECEVSECDKFIDKYQKVKVI